MNPGWTDPLLVFAMDHRDSFRRLLGLEDSGSGREHGRRVKSVVLGGFLEALGGLEDRAGAAVLVDDEYAGHLVGRARDAGALVCLPLERSGQAELQWEYGGLPESAAVVDRLRPDLVKVLVRYNPAGDPALNARQAALLAQASSWCGARGLPLMIEVLMPPTAAQRAAVETRPERWDAEVRPTLMVETVYRLRAAGADPAVWKVEGLDAPEQAASVARAAREGGRDDVSCIVLGRGADLDRVETWLTAGAAAPGYVGFAVGRSLWNGPAAAYDRGEVDAAAARTEIAARYLRLCRSWRAAVAAPTG